MLKHTDYTEKEIMAMVSFPETSPYLGVNETKEVKDFYSEKFKTSMKQIEEVPTNMERLLMLGIEELISG